jgi:glycosyltransferase involved in cell wall biosynthesis
MSRISIIIPMFNEARHIGRTLLAAQKAAHAADVECELIVVDNGSSDDGPHIARQFGAQVLVLPGLLIGALRNRGALLASGEWIAFIDADVEMPEDWLKPLFELQAEGQADVFGLDLHTPLPRRGTPLPGNGARCARPARARTRWTGYPAPTC